ncbi:hypothetical protein FRC17_000647 [Serendipita sp. 399]|nr:hypothetical protein FRC17_000647 [Serendipita sp. 399]
MAKLFTLLLNIASLIGVVYSAPISNSTITNDRFIEARAGNCFPALGFRTPNPNNGAPSTPVSRWWCPLESENGFLGFTYAGWNCQSRQKMEADFSRMRTQFKARYVRMYGWCDDDGTFLNNMIKAAYKSGVGIYATIWFGFDGDDAWVWRRDQLVHIIQTNPLARYVIRSVDVGSEPLYDWVLPPQELANQIYYVKSLIGQYGIKVSISEMQYGYSVQGDSQMVLDAEDVVHAHQLPFFDWDASTGQNAMPSLLNSTNWFVQQTYWTKKIIYTQTGWPTNANVWAPNSPNAVASVDSARAYYNLLDGACEQLKSITPQGGVGWFWHIWEDAMLDGWGILDWDSNPKWNFAPRTGC